MRLGTLHVLEAVVDLSANSAILTSVQFNLSLDRLPGGHLHVSVTGSGRISDLIVPLEVTKRHGVTATDLSSNSLWVLTLRPKPTTHGRQATIHDHFTQSYHPCPSAVQQLDAPALHDHRPMSSRVDQVPGCDRKQDVARTCGTCFREEEVTRDPMTSLDAQLACVYCGFKGDPSLGQSKVRRISRQQPVFTSMRNKSPPEIARHGSRRADQ